MESANKAFEEGAYQNTMELNHDGGDLRIGIANQGYIYSNWCIFDNFKLEYWCQLISVTSVSIDGPSTVNLIKGEQHRLTATVSPSAATFKEVKWKSNNTSVATVDDSGLVTALRNVYINYNRRRTELENSNGTLNILRMSVLSVGGDASPAPQSRQSPQSQRQRPWAAARQACPAVRPACPPQCRPWRERVRQP